MCCYFGRFGRTAQSRTVASWSDGLLRSEQIMSVTTCSVVGVCFWYIIARPLRDRSTGRSTLERLIYRRRRRGFLCAGTLHLVPSACALWCRRLRYFSVLILSCSWAHEDSGSSIWCLVFEDSLVHWLGDVVSLDFVGASEVDVHEACSG